MLSLRFLSCQNCCLPLYRCRQCCYEFVWSLSRPPVSTFVCKAVGYACEGMPRQHDRHEDRSQFREPPFVDMWERNQIHQKAAHVCAICDDGGHLIICDGPCLRHFHCNNNSNGARLSKCPRVGVRDSHVGLWRCADCALNCAQCAMCGKAGSWISMSANPKLRKCPDELCTRFYCYDCLPPDADACPLHLCKECGLPDGADWDKIVACPRCPSAWHLECLTKAQSNGYATDRPIYHHSSSGVNRAFFYCLRHEIDPNLQTPVRDHMRIYFHPPPPKHT